MRDFALQRRQVSLYHIPDQLQIDAEIIMDEFVPHPGDGLPRNVRMSVFEPLRQMFGRFAYDL